MTRRDAVWRGTGLAVFLAALTTALIGPVAIRDGLVLPCFVAAIGGIVLMVQGKRVPAVWRIERSRHRDLPQAIRARRHRGSRDGNP